MSGPKRIVLFGMGHTNVHILKQWAEDPLPDTELVCLSKFAVSTYSGMLPGTLAGQFSPDEMEIDLRPLAQKANATLMIADVSGFDSEQTAFEFSDGTRLPFDVASIGVGSMPSGWDQQETATAIPIKPMQTFLARLSDRLFTVSREKNRDYNISVIGGGAAGTEVALCLQARLDGGGFDDSSMPENINIQLITSSDEIANDMRPRSRASLKRILKDRGIKLISNTRVSEVTTDAVISNTGRSFRSEATIWATGAVAPPVLQNLGLPTDEKGFLLTRPTLQTVADLPIFAVGDAGTVQARPFPKAGVFAVRQIPTLWQNLRATLTGEPLTEFHPQGDFLKILNTGKGKALMEYKSVSIHATWCMKLKTWIDKRFISHYQLD